MKQKRIMSIIAALLLTASLLCGCQETGGETGETFDYSGRLDETGFFTGVTATDYVVVPDFKSSEVPGSVIAVDEQTLADEIAGITSNYPQYEHIVEGAVQDGDTVNISYVAAVDGAEVDSTNGVAVDFTIGEGGGIGDFETQLIGKTVGNFDVEVVVPDAYDDESVRGKTAVYNVTLNYIRGEQIESELTDDIAADYGYSSAQEFLEVIEKSLLNEQYNVYFENLVANCEYTEIPETITDFVNDNALAYYEEYAVIYGMDLDEFLQTQLGVESREAFLEQYRAQFQSDALKCLVAQAIAETEGLSVSDEYLEQLGILEYESVYGKPYLIQYALSEYLVPEYVVQNGVIYE